jgi:hypothetical protein
MPPLELIRRHLGSNLEGVARLRLGRGVMGNTTYAFYAAVAAAVAALYALKESPLLAVSAGAGIMGVYLIYLFGTYFFGRSHPDLAMLGDSEWLALQQMAAKNRLEIPDLPSISDPSKSLTYKPESPDAPEDA